MISCSLPSENFESGTKVRIRYHLGRVLKSKGTTLDSQSYVLSSSHVQMWEMDYKEGREPKNWCFWTVVLEKTLESPLDSKEIKSINPKESQS